MKASGNGTVATCVGNLLRIVRGEVPYERLKGMDPRLIDAPSSEAGPQMIADAEWLVANYEPRADLDSINFVAEAAENGHFNIKAKL